MTPSDEAELNRLTEMLRSIASERDPDSAVHEALKKGALALTIGFVRGLQREIERAYESLDAPLDSDQLRQLRQMGVDARKQE